jgi:formylglycine-generating enzyme required for sulfatase activity
MEDGFVFTAPVGRFPANGFGLFDTSGNVWEWCSDWYAAEFDPASPEADPAGPANGTHRVMRGGGRDSSPRGCRSASRWRGGPSIRSLPVRFRVVMVP